MSQSTRRLYLLAVPVAVLLLVGGVVLLWLQRDRLPQPGSPLYEEYVEAFQLGTTALDSGMSDLAGEKLTEAIGTIPEEPAGWTNRGIYYLRQTERQKAAADLEKARQLAPGNDRIQEALGLLAECEGKLSEAEHHFRAALVASPNNVVVLYRLYNHLKESDGDDGERIRLLDQILKLRPASLFTHSKLIDEAIRTRNQALLLHHLTQLERLSGGWHAHTRAALANLRKDAVLPRLPDDVRTRSLYLANLLRQEAGFARDAEAISPHSREMGRPLHNFLLLKPWQTTPAPPDLGITCVKGPLRLPPNLAKSKSRGDQVVFPVWLNARESPVVLLADAKQVRRVDGGGLALPFPSGKNAVTPGLDGVLAVDWSYDELLNLVFAGAGGLRFYRNERTKGFVDVTTRTKLPKAILDDDYVAVWAADIDFDGDIDLIAARRKGPPVLLKNRGNGTFTAEEILPGVEGVRAFAWLDLDNDGMADAALLDQAGQLHVFMNQRSAGFKSREVPAPEDRYAALAVADVNGDGVLDLIALRQDGRLARLSHQEKDNGWEVAELGKLDKKLPLVPGECRLIAVDLDNNGAIDMVLRTNEGGQVWLATARGSFLPVDLDVPAGTADVVSLDDNGQMDFLGWPAAAAGKEIALGRWTTKGPKDYRWLNLRARAKSWGSGAGDDRINSLCLGSDVEIRAGLLVVKQPIDRPVVHFGLGPRKSVPAMRLGWTNGIQQFEFSRDGNAIVTVEQRIGW
jgi:hypothetical protein